MAPTSDITDLRRCIRDLAAINALPLLWVGQNAREVVNGFLDALLTALRLDFAYTRIGIQREVLSSRRPASTVRRQPRSRKRSRGPSRRCSAARCTPRSIIRWPKARFAWPSHRSISAVVNVAPSPPVRPAWTFPQTATPSCCTLSSIRRRSGCEARASPRKAAHRISPCRKRSRTEAARRRECVPSRTGGHRTRVRTRRRQ